MNLLFFILTILSILFYVVHRSYQRVKSVDAGGEKDLLNDRHNVGLTEVKEELVKLLLVSAVQNEVGSEDKDTSRKDRQDFKSLKANNPVQVHVHIFQCELLNLR